MGEPVRVALTGDEALVLFEFLARYVESDAIVIEDQAEQRALWNLLGLLEKQLVEPFASDYLDLLRQSRDRLRDPLD
jgi:hypothetical protein